MSIMDLPLWKRAAMVPFMMFALWLLTDDESSIGIDGDVHTTRHHLAVMTALRRHPPCLRVYRSLLEVNLLLWGVVVSLWLWKSTIGNEMVGHLLFQPADTHAWKKSWERFLASTTPSAAAELRKGDYSAVETEDFLPLEVDDILVLGKSSEEVDAHFRQKDEIHKKAPSRSWSEEGFDAHYDSDGEVTEDMATKVLGCQPPSVQDVAAVAVDSLVLILVSLLFFTISSAEGGRYVDGITDVNFIRWVALIAAPLFPLILFLGFALAIFLPWDKRSSFWRVLSFTVGAPIYHVTFRDGFIGDILTSSVRPMQDIAFTVFYILSGLQGWWRQAYDLDKADLPLETNWILHTCILPMCMVSPLWWRFLQNLRQCYEYKKRWPYLGNALKYFLAAQVATFGLFHPSSKQSVAWLASFVMATLYQVWWDVFMDWELLEWDGKKLRLRSTRIYSVEWMYWAIFAINFGLRFCWTLSFLPPHYLNRSGVLSDQFEGDISHVLNTTIASAEIIRRTLWGFLRVELEAIKVARKDPKLKGVWSDDHQNPLDGDLELKIMAMEGIQPIGTQLEPRKSGWISSDMYMLSELQILGELCLYGTIFSVLGLLIAAHRITM